LKTVGAWEKECRHLAGEYQTLRAAETHPVKTIVYFLAELFWRLLAGFAAGFIGGYISHLTLDALTPRGLPLLSRQFC
jgi:hypothetical protein